MTHFGDPCIHCNIAHDEVLPGPCMGDLRKVVPIAFVSLGVRWDNVEHFRVRLSNGSVQDRWHHIEEQAPYWNFGYGKALSSPVRYDETLRIKP